MKMTLMKASRTKQFLLFMEKISPFRTVRKGKSLEKLPSETEHLTFFLSPLHDFSLLIRRI
jgi:hypothetical protein